MNESKLNLLLIGLYIEVNKDKNNARLLKRKDYMRELIIYISLKSPNFENFIDSIIIQKKTGVLTHKGLILLIMKNFYKEYKDFEAYKLCLEFEGY